jgi:5'-3' exonuclease
MRTYDDSFSGQKIYPGKVRAVAHPSCAPRAHVEIAQRARQHRTNTQDMGAEARTGIAADTQ